jgi:hypothetical protein
VLDGRLARPAAVGQVLVVSFEVEPIAIENMEVKRDHYEENGGQDQEALKRYLDISKGHFDRRVCHQEGAVGRTQGNQQAEQCKAQQGEHGQADCL